MIPPVGGPLIEYVLIVLVFGGSLIHTHSIHHHRTAASRNLTGFCRKVPKFLRFTGLPGDSGAANSHLVAPNVP